MASMNDIKIQQELRPCIANGRKALFHKWYEEKNVKQAILRGETGGEISFLWAVVEMEDGMIKLVHYSKIKFVGNKIEEYAFDKGNHIPTVDFNIDDDDLPF